MKILQSIIDKLQLYPSTKHVGQSFINGQNIYSSDHHLLQNWLVMECDLRGNPSQYVTLYDQLAKKSYETKMEFLEETDIELVLATIVNYC